jgi:VanZ family protein
MTAVARRVWALGGQVPVAFRWLSVVLWAGMIFVLSNQPGLHASEDPGVDRPLRHVAHVVVYAVLTVLIGWALARARAPSRRVVVIAGALAFLYGITDEWHQTFVPSRSGRPEDLIWDGIGVLIGGTLLWFVARAADPDPPRPT